jgi:hypothetical protein
MQVVEIEGEPVVETMYTPYSLRHFFASVLCRAPVPLRAAWFVA